MRGIGQTLLSAEANGLMGADEYAAAGSRRRIGHFVMMEGFLPPSSDGGTHITTWAKIAEDLHADVNDAGEGDTSARGFPMSLAGVEPGPGDVIENAIRVYPRFFKAFSDRRKSRGVRRGFA